MKHIKLIIVTLILFSLAITELRASIVYIRETSGGGANGFDKTSTTTIIDENGQYTNIKCEGAGYTECPTVAIHNPNPQINADITEAAEHAINEIGNGNLHGSDIVNGYQVEWSAIDINAWNSDISVSAP